MQEQLLTQKQSVSSIRMKKNLNIHHLVARKGQERFRDICSHSSTIITFSIIIQLLNSIINLQMTIFMFCHLKPYRSAYVWLNGLSFLYVQHLCTVHIHIHIFTMTGVLGHCLLSRSCIQSSATTGRKECPKYFNV